MQIWSGHLPLTIDLAWFLSLLVSFSFFKIWWRHKGNLCLHQILPSFDLTEPSCRHPLIHSSQVLSLSLSAVSTRKHIWRDVGDEGETAAEQTWWCQDLCLHGFLKAHLPNKIFLHSPSYPSEREKKKERDRRDSPRSPPPPLLPSILLPATAWVRQGILQHFISHLSLLGAWLCFFPPPLLWLFKKRSPQRA